LSFAALSEKEQADRLGELARSALLAFGFEGARVSLLKYRENAVFRIDADGTPPHVLRVHRPGYRSDAEIESEIAWMRAVSASGIRTPSLVVARDGSLVVTRSASGVPEPRQCDLQGWIEGTALGSLEAGVDLDAATLRSVYRTVGRVAAELHAHGERWRRPEGFVRPSWDANALVGDTPVFGAFWDLPELDGATRDALLRARDRSRRVLEKLPAPSLLVHGDLIPDNLLVAGDALHVIDFDDCGTSSVAFEIATTLFPLRLMGGYDDALAGMLEGYRAVRPLDDDEIALLPDLLLARGLSYLGWPIGRPEIASQRPIVPFLAQALVAMAAELEGGG
jgi:Ser/Thr protein kinase RdoA (MazF antagonist)